MEMVIKQKQTQGEDWRGAQTAGVLCQIAIDENGFNWCSTVGHMAREKIDKPAPHWAVSERSFYAGHLNFQGCLNIYASASFNETPLSVTPRKF